MDNDLSTILLDKHHITVGETVTLFWHGGFTTSSTDWIGLFYSGDAHSVSNCLEYKQSADSAGKRGMKWLICGNIEFQAAENKCWFKYIHGASGSVKAISQVLYIINPDLQESSSPSGTLTNVFSGQLLDFTITGMEANNLKRTMFGRPSPYVKVNLRPGRMQRKACRLHHGPIGKTSYQSHTTEPSWRDEVFAFKASIWDMLEVEVRNRSTGIKPVFSRFLGKLHFPLRELLTMGRNRTQTFTRQLMKREPSHKVLGTFSLTIKTNCDLPGSRRSRRQASPEANEDEGELAQRNGTREVHENEENRRPSLNASTPDDDQTYRERTSTVPVHSGKSLAQVYMDNSQEAQSQPDLLGLPYSTHENVRTRNKSANNELSPEFSNGMSSRLSMPPHVFSRLAVEGFHDFPSTSSSNANNISNRTLNNEDQEASTSQEQQSSRDLEENGLGSDNDMTNTSGVSVSDEAGSSLNKVATGICPSDVGTSQGLSNVVNNVDTASLSHSTPENSNNQEIPSTSLSNSNGTPATNDNGSERDSSNNSNSSVIEMDYEPNSIPVIVDEREANVDPSNTRPASQPTVNHEQENNVLDFRMNENGADLPQVLGSETSGTVFDNTYEESPSSVVRTMSASEPSPDILIVELPLVDENSSSFNEDVMLESRSNEGEESINLVSCEQHFSEINGDNPTDTEETPSSAEPLGVSNDNMTSTTAENQESTNDSRPSPEPLSTAVACNGDSSFTAFGSEVNGHPFMDVEAEPDIMNAFSISNSSSSDLVIPSQSTPLSDDATSRRTLGSCNLRTLFQIPDNDNSLANEISDVAQEITHSATAVTTSQTTFSTNANFIENCEGVNPSTDPLESFQNTADIGVTEAVSSSNNYDPSPESVNVRSNTENLDSNETLERDVDFGIAEVLQTNCENGPRAEIEQAGAGLTNATATSSTNGTSENRVKPSTSSNRESSPAVSNERTTARAATPARIPSFTHVRYLRSKNVSIRLPSGKSTTLPVVHFVPPNIPLSPNSLQQPNVTQAAVVAIPVEAEPVLPATFVDSNAHLNRRSSSTARESLSNPGDVFLVEHRQDGGQRIGAEASTSHVTPSGATALDPGPSAASHSAPKRRSSSEGAQSGNTKVKKKGKSRNRTSSREVSVAEPRENPERTPRELRENPEVAADPSVRRRRHEDASNRQLEVPQSHTGGEQRNDASSPRAASIYVQISDFATDDDVSEESLPAQWERAVDSYGRVYYIDHENRITTWNKPSAASASETTMNDENHHRQNLDRRYQSFRRTISGRRRHCSPDTTRNGTSASESSNNTEESTNLDDEASTSSPQPSNDTSASPSGTSRPTPKKQTGENRALLNSPFVKFLTRADLTTFLRNSGTPGQYYFSHPEVKDMIRRIKEDPRKYQSVMHDRSLVAFLNGFADTSLPLPRGWEQKTDQYGQKYFVDHNSRCTNFADPRLPVDGSLSRNRSRATLETTYADRSRRPPPPGRQPPPPPRPVVNTVIHRNSGRRSRSEGITYNQQIVEFLRQTNIDTILSDKDPSYASNMALKSSVEKIRRDGQRALRLLSDNVDLIVLLSLFEDDIVSWLPETKPKSSSSEKKKSAPHSYDNQGPSSSKTSRPAPYKRDFQAKVKSFHKNLIHKGLGQGSNKIQLIIRRDHILEDAFDQIMKESFKNLRTSKLEVTFSGEEGLDYGGPQREFFFLLSRELFNPYYGLFEYSAQDTYTLHISAMSSFVDNAHDWYRFSGKIIALVIIHQHLLDAFFTRPFYKLLLKSSCDLRDVEALDALFHRSLSWIMETDITDVSLDLAFTVTEEVGGQVTERELLPGGKDIRVTEDNKLGYVELMSNWRIDRGVSEQRRSILRGFYEIMDYDLVSMFDACELELLISGTADIDVNDWFSNTEYRSGFHPNHKVIRWFWQAVHSFDNEQRLRLLQFVTGTSSVPYEGFAALRGSTGPRKFCIEKWANHKMLPRAHTCFNRLDLPPYVTYNELLEKLTLAVEETSTFGIQ